MNEECMSNGFDSRCRLYTFYAYMHHKDKPCNKIQLYIVNALVIGQRRLYTRPM